LKLTFWLLDVNYEVVREVPEVRMWGLTPEGKRVVIIDRSFKPYFYVVPKEGTDIGKLIVEVGKLVPKPLRVEAVEKKYFGEPLKVLRVTCKIPAHVPKLREEVAKLKYVKDVLEADIRFYMRYLIDNQIYPCAWHEVTCEPLTNRNKWKVDGVFLASSPPKLIESKNDIPELKVMAFDIECYNPKGTPKPARDPVILIATLNSEGEEKVFIAEGRNDRKLLRNFVEYINAYDPDVIVGYNSNSFDWPYLIERAKKLGVDLSISRTGSPPAQSVYGHYSIVGRANVDLYDFAEDIAEVKVKTLENVAEYLGVKRKEERVTIRGSEIYKYWDDPSKREELIRYVLDDVESTFGLAEKILPFAYQLARVVGLPLDQVGAASVGFRVEWRLMREAYIYNELVPNRVERPYSPYRGAIVLEPEPGIHENVAVMDFSSMYPNIMIKMNISPDTYVPPGEEVEDGEVYVAPEVGHKFRKKPDGFYRKVLSKLLKLRQEIRMAMKNVDPRSPEYRVLNERQKALKVIANATYGYCGWVGARWYKREVAEATTAWGRKIIKETINIARSLGLKIIYGDTDSIFVKHEPEKIREFCKTISDKIDLPIKPDKIYVRVFFTEAKKRYCGLLPDGRIDVVGLEAVRGDWSELAKEVQEEIIKIILKERSPEKAVDYVRKVIKELREGKIPLEKLVIWKTLTKDFEEYEVKAAHVIAARKLIKAGYQLEIGDKIGFIITKGPGGKLADKAEPYILVNDYSKVDVEYYVEKQVVPAALRILSYFGVREGQLISEGKQTSLTDFFR